MAIQPVGPVCVAVTATGILFSVVACRHQPLPEAGRPASTLNASPKQTLRDRLDQTLVRNRTDPKRPAQNRAVADPATEAVEVRDLERSRPEQQITDHNRFSAFNPTQSAPTNAALKTAPLLRKE
jgi:hypothetical protein